MCSSSYSLSLIVLPAPADIRDVLFVRFRRTEDTLMDALLVISNSDVILDVDLERNTYKSTHIPLLKVNIFVFVFVFVRVCVVISNYICTEDIMECDFSPKVEHYLIRVQQLYVSLMRKYLPTLPLLVVVVLCDYLDVDHERDTYKFTSNQYTLTYYDIIISLKIPPQQRFKPNMLSYASNLFFYV